MPIQGPQAAGRFAFSTLKAFVQFTGGGSIIKSSNIASVTRTAAGTYNIAFTNAMDTTAYMIDSWVEAQHTAGSGSDSFIDAPTRSTAGITGLRTYKGGATADYDQVYLGFYE